MKNLAACLLLALAPLAAAESVDESTGTGKPRTVEDIYGGGKFRDPFRAITGGGAVVIVSKEFSLEDFSIHSLDLKGIMKDNAGSFAMLYDPATKTSFILRGGKLYLKKDQTIPGVTGKILPAQKSVILMTTDKDVQRLRLGEEEDDSEDGEE